MRSVYKFASRRDAILERDTVLCAKSSRLVLMKANYTAQEVKIRRIGVDKRPPKCGGRSAWDSVS